MTKKLGTTLIVCYVLLFATVVVCAQDREKVRTPIPLNSESPSIPGDSADAATVQHPQAPCHVAMTLLYETLRQYLSDGKEVTTEALKSAAQSVVGSDPDIVVAKLNDNVRPDVFVGYSCNVDVSQSYATFRVFRFEKSGYAVAARSEDYPVLATRTAEGLSIDEGSLEVSPLISDGVSQSAYLSTVWTQGGGRPAPFSIVVWRWDGDSLRPLWQKLEIRNGTVNVIPPLVVVTTASKTVAGANDVAAYRLVDDHVVSDGSVTPRLLQKYTEMRVLNPTSTDDLVNTGYLWESVGQPDRAAAAYEQAISKDKTGQRTYLYLTLADIYERTGKTAQSAKTLRAYQKAAKRELSSSSNKTIEDRIQRLQQMAPQP